MSYLAIDLGQLSLSHIESKTRFVTHAYARFLAANDTFSGTEAQFIQLLRCHSVWVCRGIGLHLKVQFLLNGNGFRNFEYTSSLLKSVGQVLQTAELWDQLGLDAVLMDDPMSCPDSADHSSLILSLKHSLLEDVSRRRLHRYGEGMASCDIKPPSCVPTYFMNSIHLVVDLQSESHALLEDIIMEPSQSCREAEIFDTGIFTLGITLAAMDAVLRLWISSKTARFAKGLKIITDGRIATLAEIAPAIWRPGYLQALADRVHLMPSVSFAISSLATRRIDSLALEAQVKRLSALSIGPQDIQCGISPDGLRHGNRSKPQKLADLLIARLWMVTQRNLYDSMPTRVLKPLVPLFKQGEKNKDTNLEMLFESQETDQIHDAGHDFLEWYNIVNDGYDEGVEHVDREADFLSDEWLKDKTDSLENSSDEVLLDFDDFSYTDLLHDTDEFHEVPGLPGWSPVTCMRTKGDLGLDEAGELESKSRIMSKYSANAMSAQSHCYESANVNHEKSEAEGASDLVEGEAEMLCLSNFNWDG